MKRLLLALPLLLATAACAAQDARSSGARGRLAPPPTLDCDRNDLTSFQGTVASVRREDGGAAGVGGTLTVTLVTDWDSEETFTVPVEAPQLRNGQPLLGADQAHFLAALPAEPDGLGVIAWVCSAPQRVTLDWQAWE